MAQIYPQWLSDLDRLDPKLRAEILLYDALHALPDSWTVLYHASMKWRDEHGIWDREADFILAEPSLGILVLEVKGGEITREGADWYTTSLLEREKPAEHRTRIALRRSPYDQATAAAKTLERKLNEFLGAARTREWLPIGTAVCFPDVTLTPTFRPGSDGLREITLDGPTLAALEPRLRSIMQAHTGDGSPPGKRAVEALVQVIAPSWHLPSWLGYQLETTEQRRRQLTEEQYQFLYTLEDNPRLLVDGCAGSGKTFLAAEKARRLAEQGQRVLLTCYNRNLAGWLRDTLGAQPGVRVQHFHELCYELGRLVPEAQLPADAEQIPADAEDYYQRRLPEALELAAAALPPPFDALLVDEGQDFDPGWLLTLQGLLADPREGLYYVFQDGNQDLYNRAAQFPFSWPRVRLRRNVRNTDPICAVVNRYHEAPATLQSSGISGPEPRFVSPAQHGGAAGALRYILEALLVEKIPPESIVILSSRSQRRSAWSEGLPLGKTSLTWNLGAGRGTVACSSIHGFKGLERPAVILTELEQLPVEPERRRRLLYTACSRAKTHLIVLGSAEQLRSS